GLRRKRNGTASGCAETYRDDRGGAPSEKSPSHRTDHSRRHALRGKLGAADPVFHEYAAVRTVTVCSASGISAKRGRRNIFFPGFSAMSDKKRVYFFTNFDWTNEAFYEKIFSRSEEHTSELQSRFEL